MYQALYRKYRPKSFDDVFGQKIIVETLKNAIINNKLSHAYLFSGPRGTGKTSIAKIIAYTINCQKLDGITKCDKCVCCTQKDLDIIEIDAASNNGVDEIRELKNKVSLVPTHGKYKIYIIDEVHMLTISAFNALLKTLEEPPEHVVFILATTDPQKVPATICSRCQRFDFKRIDEKSIEERLKSICKIENIKIDDNALQEICRISEGGLRDAINLLDQAYSYAENEINIETIHDINGTISQYEIEKFYKLFINNKLDIILNKINEYNEIGKNLVKLAQGFIMFLRNILIFQKCRTYLLENNIDVKPYEEIANLFNENKILELIKDFNFTINEMKTSSNPKLNLELLFIKNITITEKYNLSLNLENKKYQDKKSLKNIDNNNDESKVDKENNNLKEEEIIKNKEEETNEKEYSKEIFNTENIKKIRVENTLAFFDKKTLRKIQTEIGKIKTLLVNKKYSQFASLILDGQVKAASDKNLIFMFKINSDSLMFNENLKIIEEIIEKGLGHNYKVISVNNNDWEIIKEEFNNKKKKYKYIEESDSEAIIEDENSIIKNFKEIIEYR